MTTVSVKEVHFSQQVHHQSSNQAPCGAVVISSDPSKPQPGTDDVVRVTCRLCRAWIRETVSKFDRARRAKKIPMGYGR